MGLALAGTGWPRFLWHRSEEHGWRWPPQFPFLIFVRIIGHSDGWTDLVYQLSNGLEFDHVTDGNIALTGQLDLSAHREFTLCCPRFWRHATSRDYNTLAAGHPLRKRITKA